MPNAKPLSMTAHAVLDAAAHHANHQAFPPDHLPTAAKHAVVQSLIKAGLLEEIAADEAGPAWRVSADGERLTLRATQAGLAAVEVVPARTSPILTDDAPEATTAPASQDEPAVQPAVVAEVTRTGRQATRVGVSGLRAAASALVAAWDNPAQERSDIAAAVEALRAALAGSPRILTTGAQAGVPCQPRTETKRATVLALLQRPNGATVAQVAEATGWASHTVRGFFAGLKKAGVQVEVLERIKQVGPGNQGVKGSYTVYRVAGPA